LKNYGNVPSTVISRKTFFKEINFFLASLKVNEEYSRIRIHIRIHTKMSWIRNTVGKVIIFSRCLGNVARRQFGFHGDFITDFDLVAQNIPIPG
jgi:hypothetical protein